MTLAFFHLTNHTTGTWGDGTATPTFSELDAVKRPNIYKNFTMDTNGFILDANGNKILYNNGDNIEGVKLVLEAGDVTFLDPSLLLGAAITISRSGYGANYPLGSLRINNSGVLFMNLENTLISHVDGDYFELRLGDHGFYSDGEVPHGFHFERLVQRFGTSGGGSSPVSCGYLCFDKTTNKIDAVDFGGTLYLGDYVYARSYPYGIQTDVTFNEISAFNLTYTPTTVSVKSLGSLTYLQSRNYNWYNFSYQINSQGRYFSFEIGSVGNKYNKFMPNVFTPESNPSAVKMIPFIFQTNSYGAGNDSRSAEIYNKLSFA